jgi:hypothetical protein
MGRACHNSKASKKVTAPDLDRDVAPGADPDVALEEVAVEEQEGVPVPAVEARVVVAAVRQVRDLPNLRLPHLPVPVQAAGEVLSTSPLLPVEE